MSYFTENIQFRKALGINEIKEIAGSMLHSVHEDLPKHLYPDITFYENIRINELPSKPVFRFMEKEYANSFINDGNIRLGTLYHYGQENDPEIGDSEEGSFILVGQRPRLTTFANVKTGFNYYVLSAASIESSEVRQYKLKNYDACIQITEPEQFSEAIRRHLSAKSKDYGLCNYSKDRVVLANVPAFYNFETRDLKMMVDLHLSIGLKSKYFLKKESYSSQDEFRFIWETGSDVKEPLNINCPEIRNFCRRVF